MCSCGRPTLVHRSRQSGWERSPVGAKSHRQCPRHWEPPRGGGRKSPSTTQTFTGCWKWYHTNSGEYASGRSPREPFLPTHGWQSMTSQCQVFHRPELSHPSTRWVSQTQTASSFMPSTLQEPVMDLRVRTLSPSDDPMIFPTQVWTKFQSLEPPERVSPVWTVWI